MADKDLIEIIFKSNTAEQTKLIKSLASELKRLGLTSDSTMKSYDRYEKQVRKTSASEESLEKAISKTAKSKDSSKKANDGLISSGEKVIDNTKKMAGNFSSLLDKISPVSLGAIGLSLSFGGMVNEAFSLTRELSRLGDQMTFLASDTGDVTGAVGLLYKTAGDSTLSRGSMMGVLKTLSDGGVQASKSLHDLGVVAGNLQSATGIAASEWGGLTSELSYRYNIPLQGIKNISSGLVATGLKGAQLQKAMGTVNKVLDQTAFLSGKVTPKSMEMTTKAVGGAIAAFDKLGISAEKSGAFLESLTNPEDYEKNAYMLSRMGIGADEYASYLNDADGQAKLLQKTMSNLPALANEISSIQNPFARMNLAKSIGLPMEIVQKMAGKTQSEIQAMMDEYQKKAKDDEALKKKEEKKKAEDAKFDDMLQDLRMNALAPLMKFVSQNLGPIMNLLRSITQTFSSILTAAMPTIDSLTKTFLTYSGKISSFMKDFVPPFIEGLRSVLSPIFDFFKNLLGRISKFMPKGAGNQGETAGKAAGVAVAAFVGFKVLSSSIKSLKGAFTSKGKTVQNATVGELADAIGEAVATKGGKGPLMKRLFDMIKEKGVGGAVKTVARLRGGTAAVGAVDGISKGATAIRAALPMLGSLQGIGQLIGGFGRTVWSAFKLVRMLTPMGAAITVATTILFAIIKDVYENFDYFKVQFLIFKDSIVGSMKKFWDGIKGAWNSITNFFTNNAIGKGIWSVVNAIIPVDAITRLIKKAIPTLKEYWGKFKNWIMSLIDGFLNLFSFGDKDKKAFMKRTSESYNNVIKDITENTNKTGNAGLYTKFLGKDGTIDEKGLAEMVATRTAKIGANAALSKEEKEKYDEILTERVKEALIDRAERKKQHDESMRNMSSGFGSVVNTLKEEESKPPEIKIDDLAALTYATLTGSRLSFS